MLSNTMSIKIRHGILDLVNKNRSSAIIINDSYILASAFILNPVFISLFTNEKDEEQLNNFKNKINKQLINVDEDPLYNELKLELFTITFDRRKPTDRNSRILTCYKAKLLYIFNSIEIRECFQNILSKLKSESELNNELKSFLHSSFLILQLIKPNEAIKNVNLKSFIKNMLSYSNITNNLHKTDEVMAICSPFGIENFYKTIHFGKISNILGRNSCLFIISNSLPIGCEGSAVFNNRLKLIGILICTSLSNGDENINITLAANFHYIFKSLAFQFGVHLEHIGSKITLPTWEKSLVIIFCNGQQGTGTLVKVLNRKFILTCSHVINDNSSIINCRYIDGTFPSEIIWKNPNFDEPFDVAILSVPDYICDDYFVSLSDNRPYLGQNIFNAGFPFFTNTQEKNFAPGIFEGRVIKYKPGCIIADATLQAGQSGGPMFAENGTILGICVSNLKLEKTVFPNVNTSIPACDIKYVIEKFAKTNDISVLNKLIASPEVKKIWSLDCPIIDCKL
ncbi:uncharacterized protein LOC129611117 [Condylostylus longicornis]|uniref:uncharacterized protein LOC129611117 n=1 Tax=Condylostylus longicornis TaxID=2530218 RepID=UPI00244DC02F|nr:uncharacterized protein LOC129611117 [Condylostylus longicornis]